MSNIVLFVLVLFCGLPLVLGILAFAILHPAWFLSREEREW
jgi:hypothetical protein